MGDAHEAPFAGFDGFCIERTTGDSSCDINSGVTQLFPDVRSRVLDRLGAGFVGDLAGDTTDGRYTSQREVRSKG